MKSSIVSETFWSLPRPGWSSGEQPWDPIKQGLTPGKLVIMVVHGKWWYYHRRHNYQLTIKLRWCDVIKS